ncbi:MAG: hypothetical protein COW65_01210 [Cytophagales bacterium CG18_big_fil_WC_8_21_14_2_50_42_9]|nr:MAG: hypothetical protein COW65_01210 [Cytophagales bacterium CG18_big_fil_WC_8_21_14_2_50_42_9]
MERNFDLVVVMPIGPNGNVNYIDDTINSIKYYFSCKYKLIILDDSHKGTGDAIQKMHPDAEVLKTKKNRGVNAGLYLNLCQAYQHALQQYNFEVLLKIDDDALITGHDPDQEALQFFRKNPGIGMAGLYQTGENFTNFLGNQVDNSWPRKQLMKDTCTWKIMRRPIANFTLRKLFFKAIRKGYEIGENIQGGAYFLSKACLNKLNETQYLPVTNLKTVNLGEDHLLSLLTKLAGFKLGDLSSGNLPLGTTWKGLPGSPEVLRSKGKKIIHSTRSWQDMNEDQIRAYFKQFRLQEQTKHEAA